MRAVPCALAAQTRGGVDSRDERRTLASEVLRMSRALREVLRMSCEARYKQRRFRRKRPHNSAIFFNKTQKGYLRRVGSMANTGTRCARCPYFPYSGRETPIFAQVEV